MTTLIFKLKRPATRQGGDRYEHGVLNDKDFMVVYVPQYISRAGDKIKPELTISIG